MIKVRASQARLLGDLRVVPEAFNLVVVSLPGSGLQAPSTQSIRLDPGPGLDERTPPETGGASESGGQTVPDERSLAG